jgi:site-specific DNA recombinase
MSEATNQAVAIYARVSTEDQAERETIQNQLGFLRRFVDLHALPFVDEYVDDGISGTVPLADRPEGQRLLIDAEAGRFGSVLVYRIDRLGRSLRALLDAHDTLSGYSVAIRSATEPFDSGTPIGAFLFQLLGSLAELEKSTIAERTGLGRNRVASSGGYTGGPIPLGYDLDEAGRLMLSARNVPQLGMTEAEMVADIFARVANGRATVNGECERLTALGIPRQQRYPNGRILPGSPAWGLSSLRFIIHNPTYKGAGVVKSRYGQVTRPAPALVDEATWERAQAALLRNRKLSRKNATRTYLLRGLITCSGCGRAYTGATKDLHTRGQRRNYRCTSQCGDAARRQGGQKCPAKILSADWLEDAVWEECRRFIHNPGEALDEARRKLRERMTEATGFEDRRRALLTQLAEKETERERVLTFFRRGTISDDEAERELDAVAREAGQLREMIESLRAQSSLVEAQESFLTDSAALLSRLQDELGEIEATNDLARKREVIERYVRKITVDTRRIGPRKLEADVRVYLRLKPEPIAVVGSAPWRAVLDFPAKPDLSPSTADPPRCNRQPLGYETDSRGCYAL